MAMKSFPSLHPIVLFFYFSIWIGYTMLVNDPLNMALAFISAHVLYALCVSGKQAFQQLIGSIAIVTFVACTNLIFVHQGVTILFYYNDNPITLEAFYYGAAFGAMLASVLTQCRMLHRVMDTDKILYLFARFMPTIALILAMTLRLIPKFQRHAKTILNTQRTLGVSIHQGSPVWRVRVVMMVFSMMITWAFEHGVECADSMKARGYGTHIRTNYANYTWTRRDTIALLAILLLGIILMYACFNIFTHYYYYPHRSVIPHNITALSSYGSFITLGLLPIMMEGREYFLWHYVRVRI